LRHEQEIVAKWKADGILEHLFLRPAKNGAVLIFKNKNEEEVKALMQELPFYKLKKSIEYLNLIKQF
jgi:muconolactone delta-isomerase